MRNRGLFVNQEFKKNQNKFKVYENIGLTTVGLLQSKMNLNTSSFQVPEESAGCDFREMKSKKVNLKKGEVPANQK